MKQIKRLKREKVSLFLAAAVLSLGILSGCARHADQRGSANRHIADRLSRLLCIFKINVLYTVGQKSLIQHRHAPLGFVNKNSVRGIKFDAHTLSFSSIL